MLIAGTVTLKWDASPTQDVFRYRAYEASLSGAFQPTAETTNLFITMSNISATEPTRFYVTALSLIGYESIPSNVVTNSPVAPPPLGLSFEAESGALTVPFYVNGTVVQQDVQTAAADGGRATYSFNVATAGVYNISATVNAPNEAQNSFFVNIDAEPTDANAWHIPVTIGIQARTVTWLTETNARPFTLSVGQHTLIFRGREERTQLDRISIVLTNITPPPPQPPAAPTNLRLTEMSGRRRDLGWTAALDTSAVIEKAIESDPFTQVATVAAGTQHWIDVKSRQKLTRYRVKACKVLCSEFAEITFRPTR